MPETRDMFSCESDSVNVARSSCQMQLCQFIAAGSRQARRIVMPNCHLRSDEGNLLRSRKPAGYVSQGGLGSSGAYHPPLRDSACVTVIIKYHDDT